MTARGICINGRFLGRPISGVERYGREIVRAWDALLVADPSLPRPRIVAPAGVTCDLELHAMRFETSGRLRGHAWEQIDLPLISRGDVLVSLANSGPVAHPRHLCVVHDAAAYRFGENYSFAYRTLHRTLGRLLARSATLGTVSRFSQGELQAFLGVPSDAILIAGNGSEHLSAIAADESVMERLGLSGQHFIMAVGTPSYRKNLQTAIAAWQRIRPHGARMLIVGPMNDRIFASGQLATDEGVDFVGRLTDGELKALFGHACALVFPSRYEGFGIPPLEAMVNGCPVLASNIPPVREVCGDHATYFEPDDIDALAALIEQRLAVGRGTVSDAVALQQQAAKSSWTASAGRLAQWAMDSARRGT